MRSGPDISLDEAQRRFIRMLKEKEYPPAPRWVLDGATGIYSSHFMGGLIRDVRALMWREGKKWAASLSMRVGERGEWILAGGLIGRQKKQNWKLPSPITLMNDASRMAEIFQRWGMEKDRYLNVIAMVKFAHKYTRAGPGSRILIERVLSGIESGVTSEATVSEALSIVQHLYCRTRLDRITACGVWREVFR